MSLSAQEICSDVSSEADLEARLRCAPSNIMDENFQAVRSRTWSRSVIVVVDVLGSKFARLPSLWSFVRPRK